MDREKMDEIIDRVCPQGWGRTWRADIYRMMEEAYSAGLAKGAAGAAGLVQREEPRQKLHPIRHHTCVKCLRLFQTRIATQQYCPRCVARGPSV